MYADLNELFCMQLKIAADIPIKYRNVMGNHFDRAHRTILDTLVDLQKSEILGEHEMKEFERSLSQSFLCLEIANKLGAIGDGRFGQYLEKHVHFERRVKEWCRKNEKDAVRNNNELGKSDHKLSQSGSQNTRFNGQRPVHKGQQKQFSSAPRASGEQRV